MHGRKYFPMGGATPDDKRFSLQQRAWKSTKDPADPDLIAAYIVWILH
jgi:hypothetical protein|tara:strand:- start:257 stop:400 length:144 start_codon:yes stop_codon:yes gene_type:complete